MTNFVTFLSTHWADFENSTIQTIFKDYKDYHSWIAILFLALTISCLTISYKLFKHYKKTPKHSSDSKGTLLTMVIILALGAFSTLLTLANFSNSIGNPENGYLLAVSSFQHSTNASEDEKNKIEEWILSGETSIPKEVNQQVEKWRLFHIKKTILFFFIVAGLMILSITFKNRLSKKETTSNYSILNYILYSLLLIVTAFSMLVLLANVQGSLSPLYSYIIKLT